jgi:hypothetical protein
LSRRPFRSCILLQATDSTRHSRRESGLNRRPPQRSPQSLDSRAWGDVVSTVPELKMQVCIRQHPTTFSTLFNPAPFAREPNLPAPLARPSLISTSLVFLKCPCSAVASRRGHKPTPLATSSSRRAGCRFRVDSPPSAASFGSLSVPASSSLVPSLIRPVGPERTGLLPRLDSYSLGRRCGGSGVAKKPANTRKAQTCLRSHSGRHQLPGSERNLITTIILFSFFGFLRRIGVCRMRPTVVLGAPVCAAGCW